MSARSSAKFARPRVRTNVCVLTEKQLKDHRDEARQCRNHVHHSPERVKYEVKLGTMAFIDRNGNATPAQTRVAMFTANAAKNWQKTRSSVVSTMQLKVGLKGRNVPEYQKVKPLVLT